MRFRDTVTIVSPDREDVEVKGSLQNSGSSEDENLSIEDWMLFLPPDVEITHRDRVVSGSREFEIVSVPVLVKNELTANKPHHLEVSLHITGVSSISKVFPDDEAF